LSTFDRTDWNGLQTEKPTKPSALGAQSIKQATSSRLISAQSRSLHFLLLIFFFGLGILLQIGFAIIAQSELDSGERQSKGDEEKKKKKCL